jgi:hypothetical protein
MSTSNHSNDYKANIYSTGDANPVVDNADKQRKRVGICFSGGGSRALTCAWGQMIGLRSLQGASGKTLLDEARYISSVSGGTWASVLYTFHDPKISDNVFLGPAYAPSQLAYGKTAQGLNVCEMADKALGKVPINFGNLLVQLDTSAQNKAGLPHLDNIFLDFLTLLAIKRIPLRDAAQWLWMYIVGKNVLADYGLYAYSTSLFRPDDTPWNFKGAQYFSWSQDYAKKAVFANQPAPDEDDFVYARTLKNGAPACPMLIVNTNIVADNCPNGDMEAPMQIPAQLAPTAGGVNGVNPCSPGMAVGGGWVESFGFASKLLSKAGGKVSAEFPRTYMLADITACSSAFYAATLIEVVQRIGGKIEALDDKLMDSHLQRFLEKTDPKLVQEIRAHFSAMQADAQKLDLEDFAPQYNYWPVGVASQGAAANKNTYFTDGGSMDNTGVAGLLAQVQDGVSHIIAFVNGSEVLEKAKNGQIIAATQMAPLFGVAYDENSQSFKNYGGQGVNPFTGKTDPLGFMQVFDNTGNAFDALRQGLYAANGAGAASHPAFCRQALKVVANALLGVKAQAQPIQVLWVQNARVNAWQSQITDAKLREKIEQGQKLGKLSEFADFPYYSTFIKIHANAAETNVLAQMWAWCVGSADSPLRKAIAQVFAEATV